MEENNSWKLFEQRRMRRENRVVNRIMKEHPQVPHYIFGRCDEDGCREDEVSVPVTEKERQLIEEYYKQNMKEDGLSLHEYLEDKGQHALLRRIFCESEHEIYHIAAFVTSCDLSQCYYPIRCKVFTYSYNYEWTLMYTQNMMATPKEFKQLLALGVRTGRSLSVNELVYKMPKLAQRWMRNTARNLSEDVLEFDRPFTIEIVDFFELLPKKGIESN